MKLKESYLTADKKEKTRLLNEYTQNTGHNRKYVIATLNSPTFWDNINKPRKARKKLYGAEIEAPLTKLWGIFDFPCGQRLKPCITEELERLRSFGEINVTDEVAVKLLRISPATIDRKLARPRKAERLRRFSTTRPGSLLKKKIPIRLTDWDTSKIGFLEADLVAHCGGNASGQFANTVSLTEIATGWWEGEAIMGKGQIATLDAIKLMRARSPFAWKGLDSDNGGEFINVPLFSYCEAEELAFTRSRENKKNDNAYVEQKNWTHVRKILGYFRYDTEKELAIINDLYRNELRLYKNFFQPVMKLAQKVRYGSKKHRKYEPAKTPYRRLLESNQIPKKTKAQLKALHETLNPAALKRRIDHKLCLLLQAYRSKRRPIRQRQTKEKEVSSGLGIS
ncbi:MAG: hypothetical protein KJ732_00845 [Candidatus Margulisbacteria bacterium]|nr:hypothetical protein [Candidatus Margulisiibacteriota bacterium]